MRIMISPMLLGAMSLACQSASDPMQEVDNEVTLPQLPTTVAAGQTGSSAKAPQQPSAKKSAGVVPASIDADQVGHIREVPELHRMVARAMAITDADSDGKITREEVNGALNFVIGGFFFRADANADGTITVQEHKAARADFAQEHPETHALLTSFSTSAAVGKLMSSLDASNDQTIELKQARSTIHEAVGGIFDSVDTNDDGSITGEEAERGFNLAAATLGRAAFAKADANSDGTLTLDEFQASLEGPLRRAFDASDANNDGKLTNDEAASIMLWLSERLNSASAHGSRVASSLTEASAVKQ